MYEKEFQKTWTNLDFEGKSTFFMFLNELEENTEWIVCESTPKLYMLDATSTPAGDCMSTDDQWNDACKSQGLAFEFTDVASGCIKTGVFNQLTAPLSANERAGAKCTLTNVFLEKMKDEYGLLITKGISVFGEHAKVLIRGGQVMATLSSKYNTISQKTIFEAASTAMEAKFAKSKLLTATYNPDVTHASYAICSGNGKFMESYAKTWTDAGMPEEMLAKTFPIVDFSTSDTGRYTISIRPILKIGKSTYPLGTELKMKHNGLADVAHISGNIDKCYVEMQKSLTTIEELQKKVLIHPYAVFVRACQETGLYKTIKTICRETLDNIKGTYESDSEVSAFSMYREICDMQEREAFKNLSPNTVLQCLEAFGRLLQLDWAGMDKSGPEEF